MKKIVSCFMCILLLISLSACVNNTLENKQKHTLQFTVQEEGDTFFNKAVDYQHIVSLLPQDVPNFDMLSVISFDDEYIIFTTEIVKSNVEVGLANKVNSIIVYNLQQDFIVYTKNLEQIPGVISDAAYINNTLYFSTFCNDNKANIVEIYSISNDTIQLILSTNSTISFAAGKQNIMVCNEQAYTVLNLNEQDNTQSLISINPNGYNIVAKFKDTENIKLVQGNADKLTVSFSKNEKQFISIFDKEQPENEIEISSKGRICCLENVILSVTREDPSKNDWILSAFDYKGKLLGEYKTEINIHSLQANGKNRAYFVDQNWQLWSIEQTNRNQIFISKIKTETTYVPIRYFFGKDKALMLIETDNPQIGFLID